MSFRGAFARDLLLGAERKSKQQIPRKSNSE
jgi:hypothetical protein